MSSVDELERRFEELYGIVLDQYFKQYVGLPYDETLLIQSALKGKELAEKALEQGIKPRTFYLLTLESLSNTIGLPYLIQLSNEYEKISTSEAKLDGKPINLLTWRKFRIQTKNWSELKAVSDSFIEQAPKLIPFVEQRFSAHKEICSRYHENPLDIYLESEQIQYSKLTRLITQLAEKARKPFLKAAEHYCQEIKGESFGPQDDLPFFNHHVHKPTNEHLKGLDPLIQVRKTLKTLGFAIEKIHVDSEERPKKRPRAVCFEVQIPDDIRVAYHPSSPISHVFHEFGHVIHAISSNPKDPFWKRYWVPISVAETFSLLFEGLAGDPLFLTKQLGLDSAVAQESIDRGKASDLYGIVFLAVNSLMKLAFWKEGLSFEQASQRWQDLTRRFYIEVPGDRWLLYPINVESIFYNPSYLLAILRTNQIRQNLIEEFGEAWWEEPRAGAYIAELAATRAEFPIKQFPLNPDTYINQIKQLSFL